MKLIIYLLLICSFTYACAQQKFESPPKPGKGKSYKIQKGIRPTKIQKVHLILTLGELKQNKDSLYCWKTEDKFNIIDGKITLYSNSIARGDNASVTDRLYAEGAFLEGKYQGIWKYYDENGKVIKKEEWDNGTLISRQEFNFNTCDNLEEYKFSNINSPNYNSIEQFKNDFSIRSGKLVCENGIVKRMRLIFEDETTIQFTYINNGLITENEVQIKGDPIPSGKSYFYDKKGNVARISEVKNELQNGNGHYISYYFKNLKFGYTTIPIIKSEGEVRNNFKIGKWTCYDNEGEVISTKIYTLKDAVDVRFPYCIFNKNEPCY